MALYGFSYQGSKRKIAEKIINLLPKGKILYDLFGGGGAITHCAYLSGKWDQVVYNELSTIPYSAFELALSGEIEKDTRWISREDFFRLKDTDPYVAICFSFGNNCRTYMYGPHLEPYKRACHYAIVFDDWKEYSELCPETSEQLKAFLDGKVGDERRKIFQYQLAQMVKADPERLLNKNPLYASIQRGGKLSDIEAVQSMSRKNRFGALQTLESKERLNRFNDLKILQSKGSQNRFWNLHSLESMACQNRFSGLEALNSASKLVLFNLDYSEVPLVDDAVIYCDPPYLKTLKYKEEFDHERFYSWACTKKNIYISEYWMPEDMFECIAEYPTGSSYNSKSYQRVVEKVFIPKGNALPEPKIEALF